jgi:hypothetical protein
MEDKVMGYRKNPTDKNQNEIEGAAFEQGVPVFTDDKTRVVAKGLQTAPLRTAHSSAQGGERNNAGVVMPPSDKPGKFEQPGKA